MTGSIQSHGHPGHDVRVEHQGSLTPAARSGSLAIDVGAGYGALIIYPASRFRDLEVEISRAGEVHRVHTGVHERTTHSDSRLTAVFGSLPAGEYVIWEDSTTEGPTVLVSDGTVTELRLG